MNRQSADAVVIGGGASGLMCAGTAGERGRKVIVLEPNRDLGRKLRITGKGRCNVTNNCDIKTIMANIPGDGRFLYSALSAFPPEKVMEHFEALGVPLKTERGSRVFPQSDNANDVAGALSRWCSHSGVEVIREKATKIIVREGAVAGVETRDGVIDCESAVICTGGLSYPLTGSTGDGARMAAALGHTVMKCRPSLVPLESKDSYCGEMQGFALKNVTLSAFENDKLIYRELGEMLFTHFGVSGPLVLSASSHMRNFGAAAYRLEIDLKPGLDEKKLDARILRDFEKYRNKEFKNSLDSLAGHSMIPVLVKLSGIPEDTPVNSVTREQRRELIKLFKAFPVTISAPRPIDEAIVTSGGVCTKEVKPRTMESKLVKGLHFAGEVLDLDAYTGGFNLQIAWSTGRAAGNSI